jgi:hypothetical protein
LGRGRWPQRQPGRGLDLGQPQVGDQPRAAAGGQAGQHGLQIGDVAGDGGEEIVGLARHVVGRDDLRQGTDLIVKRLTGARVVTRQRGRDVHLQREAGRGRVELGADDPDDA